MKSGDFGYLLGTNIEFGIKCVGREVYECSFRRGRVFRPFSAKNKSTEIRPGDAQRPFPAGRALFSVCASCVASRRRPCWTRSPPSW